MATGGGSPGGVHDDDAPDCEVAGYVSAYSAFVPPSPMSVFFAYSIGICFKHDGGNVFLDTVSRLHSSRIPPSCDVGHPFSRIFSSIDRRTASWMCALVLLHSSLTHSETANT